MGERAKAEAKLINAYSVYRKKNYNNKTTFVGKLHLKRVSKVNSIKTKQTEPPFSNNNFLTLC